MSPPARAKDAAGARPDGLVMADVFAALPIATHGMVRRLVQAAGEAGLRLHLVGGPVRDLLLDREIRDVDLLVEPISSDDISDIKDSDEIDDGSQRDAPAKRLAEAATQPGGRIVSHGRFGTVRLEEDGTHVDLASARTERYRRPGALPEVELASLDDDLGRRDFSVNAMSIALASPARGATTSVYDPLGGLADLDVRQLRVLHEHSFHDDPTRALRAARLASRLDFGLSRSSRAALRSALRDGAFGAVSGERFRRELQRCFGDARLGLNPASALRSLARWHVLAALEPGLDLPREAIAPLRRLGRFVAEPVWKSSATQPWHAGMAVWLAPLAPGLRRRTLDRLSIRGEAAERIVGFPKLRDRLRPRLRSARGRGAVDVLLAPLSEDSLQALWAWSEPAERKRLVRWAAEDRPRRSLLGGADVTALGLMGPDVGRVLARTRSAYLDGEVANREEALALARELAQPGRAARSRRPPGARKKAATTGPRKRVATAKGAKKAAQKAPKKATKKATSASEKKAGSMPRKRPLS